MSKKKEDAQNAQNVPIRVTDTLIFDEGYSSMKDIEEEMGRMSTSIATRSQSQAGSDATIVKTPYNVDFLNKSSLIEGEGAARRLKLQFDVSQFDPSEVSVKVVNNKIVVSAAHREKTDNSVTLREYKREFFFPDGVDPGMFVSSISKDGVLIVEAPYPAITDST